MSPGDAVPDRAAAQGPLRSPDAVMRLARLGASHPTRLSFMRSLIRRLHRERAVVARPVWEIDPLGHGRAVYSVGLGGRIYSLVAFSTELAPERRSDRVIAEAWDASFALFDGTPSRADLDRLAANAPRQEAGRFEASELVLSRANRSVRMFEHVAARLAAGAQPDAERLRSVGYLMRTTAVYGNGKFGIADRAEIAGRPELAGAFQAEMLAVWLIRGFTLDLVEHIAAARAPGAARLGRRERRHLGVGNATGLGMAPFLAAHPELLNAWISARETALARVRAVERAEPWRIGEMRRLLKRAEAHVAEWRVADPAQSARIARLARELPIFAARLEAEAFGHERPWERALEAAADFSLETQEVAVALLLEPYGDLVDDLADAMRADETPRLDPSMTLHALQALLRRHAAWALEVDFTAPEAKALLWYASMEKLEPRLGPRDAPPCDAATKAQETPLDIARRLQALDADLARAEPAERLAAFLLRRPEHRDAARRAQRLAAAPYAEIRDNLIDASCRPIDILRCKLAFFGASKFDPKSDLWTRITLFQGAPGFDEIAAPGADEWWAPAYGAP